MNISFVSRSEPPERDDEGRGGVPLPAPANLTLPDIGVPLRRAVRAYEHALLFKTERRADLMHQAVLALRDEADRISKMCGELDSALSADAIDDATQAYGEP